MCLWVDNELPPNRQDGVQLIWNWLALSGDHQVCFPLSNLELQGSITSSFS